MSRPLAAVLASWRRDKGIKVHFQIMSDLHLEISQFYSQFDIPVRAERLILAGDIGRLCDYDNFREFLALQCRRFGSVYLVLGNHEFFSASHASTMAACDRLRAEPRLQNLCILHRQRVDIDSEVTLLGCTLWSHIPPAATKSISRRVSDFKQISDWTVERHNEEHVSDLGWLKHEIQSIAEHSPHRRICVVTHHAPSHHKTSRPDQERNEVSPAFCSDILEEQVQEWPGFGNVTHWIFGHTHWSTEFRMRETMVIANQRGYVFPHALPRAIEPKKRFAWFRQTSTKEITFDVEKIIEV